MGSKGRGVSICPGPFGLGPRVLGSGRDRFADRLRSGRPTSPSRASCCPPYWAFGLRPGPPCRSGKRCHRPASGGGSRRAFWQPCGAVGTPQPLATAKPQDHVPRRARSTIFCCAPRARARLRPSRFGRARRRRLADLGADLARDIRLAGLKGLLALPLSGIDRLEAIDAISRGAGARRRRRRDRWPPGHRLMAARREAELCPDVTRSCEAFRSVDGGAIGQRPGRAVGTPQPHGDRADAIDGQESIDARADSR